jgi:flavodoxin
VIGTSKNLIVYFSVNGEDYINDKIVDLKVGHCETVAHVLHSLVDSQLFKLETVHEYSKNYEECHKKAKDELNQKIYPKILDYVHQYSVYDNIFICFPNWCGTMPMALFTFFKCHESHQNILPICIHNGEGKGNSIKDLKKLCPNAHILKELVIHTNQVRNSKQIIKDWLKEMKIGD